MRGVPVFCAACVLLFPALAKGTGELGGLTEEEELACRRNQESLNSRLGSLPGERRDSYLEEIQKEIGLCDGVKMCICLVYASMLRELDRHAHAHAHAHENADAHAHSTPIGSAVEMPASPPQEPIFSPQNDAAAGVRSGKRLSNVGLGLLLPSIALTIYGVAGTFWGISRFSRESDPNDPNFVRNSVCNSILITTGPISFLVGLAGMITGGILMRMGRRRIEEARQMLDGLAGVKDLEIVPLVSPETNTYGAKLLLRF